jgi:predicted AlkP superfamily phosphohydrolase/phosphomutase
MTRSDWSKDNNETQEEITAMVNALSDFIKEKNLDLDNEKMDAEMGGYSAGGKIRINDTFKGINLFSTLVHETAHELLHWMQNEKGSYSSDKTVGRKEREIDAETTAYVVLSHFGFETKDAPNYLALWRATGEDVRSRKTHIQKAASEIITAIKKHMVNRTELPAEE